MSAMSIVAVIGAGVMGETLVSGLMRAGRRPEELLLTERRPERADELRERYGVEVVSNSVAAAKADTLMLVVKPQDMAEVLEEMAPHLSPQTLVVSLAAGITTPSWSRSCPPTYPSCASCRTRPRCGRGHVGDLTRLALRRGPPARGGDAAQRGRPGPRVPEKQQDAVTAISGSGPAYIFFVVEAMIESGVHLGLPRSTATDWCCRRSWARRSSCARPASTPRSSRAGHSPGGTTAAPYASSRTTRSCRLPQRDGGRP
jgi:pyrroline-5-carboxylate reductase